MGHLELVGPESGTVGRIHGGAEYAEVCQTLYMAHGLCISSSVHRIL